MRIADSYLSRNYLNNMHKLKNEISKLNNKVSTSQNISKPSDSPTGAVKLLSLNNRIEQASSFQNNISSGKAFVEESIRGLENMHEEVTNVLTKLVEVFDETKNDVLNAYAGTIDMAIETILSVANREYEGKYLYGGTDFSDKPFDFSTDNSSVEVKVSDVSGMQNIKISNSSTQQINISGNDVFGVNGQGDQIDIFTTLIAIRDNLQNGIKPSDAEYETVNQFSKHLLDKITSAGNTIVRMENTTEMLDNQKLLLEGLVEDENSVDIAKAIVDLENYDYLLQLSYKTSAMILPKSLMDYL